MRQLDINETCTIVGGFNAQACSDGLLTLFGTALVISFGFGMICSYGFQYLTANE